jgi:hypothetical protein
MANTYILIASNTLGSATSTITFSSIPATFTDLVLKMSYRTTSFGSQEVGCRVAINGVNTGTPYSSTRITQDGSTVASARLTDSPFGTVVGGGNGDGATANTFGNTELYIPAYLVAQNKPYYANFTAEDNASNTRIGQAGQFFRNTSAITSLVITTSDANNFATNSSFFLYGVKNS